MTPLGETPVIEGTLGVHVMSGRHCGESIIITLPDGRWFVVDAFKIAPPSSSSRHLRHVDAASVFIERFNLEPEKCLFVLLTHLHEDHFSGLFDLLEQLRRKNPDLEFSTHYAYRHGALMSRIEQELENKATRRPSFARDLLDAGFKAADLFQRWESEYFGAIQWSRLVDHSDYDITVAMPSEQLVSRFLGKSSLKLLKRLSASSLHPSKKLQRFFSVRANDMGLGLYLRFGTAGVFLGADCEFKAWELLGRAPTARHGSAGLGNVLHQVDLLKVPHHGSFGVWRRGRRTNTTLAACAEQCRFAIATHHVRRGSYVLPDKEGIRHLLNQGTILAVPDGALLPAGVLRSFQTHHYSCRRIRVELGQRGRPSRAAEHRSKYGAEIRSEPDDELRWVSTSLRADGSTGPWFGCEKMVFLAK